MLPLPLPLIRVLDLTISAAGASASRWLADFGAEVIAIDPPGGRREAMQAFGRNKFSCGIDTSKTEARALILRVAAGCQVVLKDGGERTLEDLDYNAFRAVRPDVVVGVIEDGDEAPFIGDVVAGAVMTALFYVRFRGLGQEVRIGRGAAEASLRQAPIVAAAHGASQVTPDLAPSGCYACSDGSLAVVVRSAEEVAAFRQIVGISDTESNDEAVRSRTSVWAAGRMAAVAAQELNRHGIAAQEVLATSGLREDRHLRARGIFEPVAAGTGIVEKDGPRIRFTRTPLHTRWVAPESGEHTGYVLRSLVGLSDVEIASLKSAAVVSGET